MKIYYNSKLRKYFKSGSIKTDKGNTIFNPTEEILKENGYEEYVGPEIEIEQKTNSEKRLEAYKNEIDSYILAYIGYTLEGNKEKADMAKIEYNLKKKSIRRQYPDD